MNGNIDIKSYEHYSKFLYFLAKSKHYDEEVLEQIEDEVINQDIVASTSEHLSLSILNFWSFSTLGYYKHSMKYVKSFDEHIKSLSDKSMILDHEIPIIMVSYGHINCEIDIDCMKILLLRIIDVIENLSYHNITVIAQALARLQIRNSTIFTKIANKIISDINILTNIDIKGIEAAQIFSAFVKCEFYNIRLLRVLEDLFLINLEDAVPQTIANMFLSH